MKIYSLHKKQKLPITKKEAWEFLSNPNNLAVITPPQMKMTILSGAERPMYAGQLLEYSVSPLPGMKTTWISEITQFVEGDYFVDIQLYGPYALWHHKHFINSIENGVELEDIIHYKLPLGWLGQLAHPLVVQPKLESIFKYRREQLEARFGTL